MAEYIDSSDEQRSQYVRNWLEINLGDSAKTFRTQSAYFRYNAIEQFKDTLTTIARTDGIVRFVLGANDGDLYEDDLMDTLQIVQEGSNTSLTVIRLIGAKFHPKCYHIEREDSTETAIVGSANLTGAGVSRNIEACVIFDTRTGDSVNLLQRISAGIDLWAQRGQGDGVFQIASGSDINALKDYEIINVVQAQAILKRVSSMIERRAAGQLGTRRSLWRSPRRRRITAVSKFTVLIAEDVGTTSIKVQNVDKRWTKKLNPSDAQQPPRAGSSPTANLRLSKAGHNIDFRRWFRDDLFGEATWTEEMRSGNTYEFTESPFTVEFLDRNLDKQTLKIDHAPHRMSGQNNVPTVLIWGHELMRELTGHSYVGKYVVIEKYEDGSYGLKIADDAPEPPLIS